MDQCSLDPYEQQLYTVFDSHDLHNEGSLDKEGLIKLCKTLQLQDKCEVLLASLLGDRSSTRATFSQFRDALLQLLGNMQQSNNGVEEKDEREVAPKYVVGSKKYGRRSRPRIDDSPTNNANHVQRSNSTNEHIKRSPNNTSGTLSNAASSMDAPNLISASVTDSCTEEMLREAWRKLGVGEDGYLNHYELILVCKAIGLNKLADSVISHLSNKTLLEYNPRISFDELLEALRKDDTWNDFLAHETTRLNENFILDEENAKVIHNITLGPDGSGFVSHEIIIEMWKTTGIVSPNLLLHDLGFKQTTSISVQELSAVLDKEIKSLTDMRIDHTCNPLVALLQAFISIYQAEIKTLKSLLQQMCDEKEKLKFDVSEANNRSTLLAQEVDESVLKMEQKAQQQYKVLEHRHTEMLRELSDQFASEKELLSMNNHELEEKIKTLESEENSLRCRLMSIQRYLGVVEDENKELVGKVADLQQDKDVLAKQIKALEVEKLQVAETEAIRSVELVDKIAVLQRDNCALKDKNDEMISQIESLSKEIQTLRVKPKNTCPEDALNNLDAFGLLGSKRRNGESSDEIDSECAIIGIGSPRLGKMRKFHVESSDSPQNFNETCNDFCGSGKLARELQELIQATSEDVLNDKFKIVEQLLKTYAIEIDSMQDTKQLQTYTNMLELLITQVLTKEPDSHNELTTTTTTTSKCTIPEESASNPNQDNALQKAHDELAEKCEDLQQALDMMRDEYEKCEDYWQKKLEEERNLYEFEQSQSNEKLNEVLARLTEYEEQFIRDAKRLSPIEESAHLEKQYVDLENEFEAYKQHTSTELAEREILISTLNEQLAIPLVTSAAVCDAAIQTSTTTPPPSPATKLSNHMIETTNLFPHETGSQESVRWPVVNPKPKQQISPFTLPSPSTSHDEKARRMPLKTKKNRRHVRSLLHPTWTQRRFSDVSSSDSDSYNSSGEPRSLKMTASKLEELEKGKEWLNEQCAQLQHKVYNQKLHCDQLTIFYCRLYHSCVAELRHARALLDQQVRASGKLQEKLAENDMLVGNLYIENAYLTKNNQRLEQQLNMITNLQVNAEY